MRIGVRNACVIASASLLMGTALSIWPLLTGMFGPLYYLIFAACAIFIYSSFVIFQNPHKAQKLCKYAMLVALAAFILGAVYP
jgi:4-hydroxybenzoate polyprenyltransferase